MAAETAVKAANHVKSAAMTPENLVEGARVGRGTFHLREPMLETVNGAKDWTAHGVLENEREGKYGAAAHVGEMHKKLPTAPTKDPSLALVLDLNHPGGHSAKTETVGDSLKKGSQNRKAAAGQEIQAGEADGKVAAKMPKRAAIGTSGTSSASLCGPG